MGFTDDELTGCIPNLRSYSRSLCRSNHEADDLVQDTLVRAMNKRNLFTPGNLCRWLCSIMHNVRVNYIRDSVRQVPVGINSYILENTADPSQHSEVNVSILDLQDSIDKLPQAEREVFDYMLLARLPRGQDFRQCAAALGIHPNTVRLRLRRARSALRHDYFSA